MMQVATVFADKILTVRNLSHKALYELSAAGTSDEIRQRVVARLEAGLAVSYEQIRAWKRAPVVRERAKPERSISMAMQQLDRELRRLTLRTRRQLEYYQIQLDTAERQQLIALQQRLSELDQLLARLVA